MMPRMFYAMWWYSHMFCLAWD